MFSVSSQLLFIAASVVSEEQKLSLRKPWIVLKSRQGSELPDAVWMDGVTPSVETVGKSLGYRSLKLARRTRLLVAA
jgi:hypothetical protein